MMTRGSIHPRNSLRLNFAKFLFPQNTKFTNHSITQFRLCGFF